MVSPGSLVVDESGDVYLAWVDKRDRETARARDEEYRGTALYYTLSTDRGASFAPNRRIAHHACECCRLAVAPAPGGGAAVVSRHVFAPGIRDHAFTLLDREGAGSAWKETDSGHTAVYGAISTDGGESWSERRSLAATEGPSDHPFLLAHDGASFLAWHTGREGLRVVAVSGAR